MPSQFFAAMGGLVWLLQWPIRALVLLLITYLPLGVEMGSFPVALLAAVVIGLLGSLLILPLKALFALPCLPCPGCLPALAGCCSP